MTADYEFSLEINSIRLRLEEAIGSLGKPSSLPRRPGADRIATAASHLKEAIGFRDSNGLPIAEKLDVGVAEVFVQLIEDLASADEWDADRAFDTAIQLENFTREQIRRTPGYRTHVAGGDDPYDDLRALDKESEFAVGNMDTERHLLQQRERVDAIVDDVQQAAGSVADSELAKAFSAYEVGERRSANYFRLGGLLVLLGVLGFSIYTTIETPTTLASSLAHLGIALSGLAAFAYLARESSQHRTVARWAAVMAVQLKTLAAFSADMAPPQREELRSFFGRRVFSELPATENRESASETALTAQSIVDIIKTARGDS
ncbi:hypothetical protein [Kribbella pratensis]|nr:hypothetical protein [Kribbella pratensis]